jgi:AcrR family transcriptional regulator
MKKKARIIPRKLPTQDRSKQLVDSLLSATAKILVRLGYEGLTTNRVAEEAGVSVGSLYQYFPNKESLIAALIQRWSDGWFRRRSIQPRSM